MKNDDDDNGSDNVDGGGAWALALHDVAHVPQCVLCCQSHCKVHSHADIMTSMFNQ